MTQAQSRLFIKGVRIIKRTSRIPEKKAYGVYNNVQNLYIKNCRVIGGYSAIQKELYPLPRMGYNKVADD